MIKNIHVHYDEEADLLEVRFGEASDSYHEEVGDDVFVRRSERSGEMVGFTVLHMKRRQAGSFDLDLPA